MTCFWYNYKFTSVGQLMFSTDVFYFHPTLKKQYFCAIIMLHNPTNNESSEYRND